MKHLLKFYLQITAVMAINVGLLYAVLTLPSPDVDEPALSLKAAGADKAELEKNLALLGVQLFQGYHADLRQVIDICGIPDGYAGRIDGDLVMIYFYNRFGVKDWVAHVSLKNGMLTGIGYNASDVNDHSAYLDWAFTEKDIPTYR